MSSQLPIPNLRVELGLFNYASLHPQIWWGGPEDAGPSIAIFDAKPPGINCASIVLNCADSREAVDSIRVSGHPLTAGSVK